MSSLPVTRTGLAWAAIAAALAVLAWLLAPMLLPFLVALTLAYALNPAVDRLARLRIPRPAGAAAAILVISVLVAGVGALMVTVLRQTVPQIGARLPALVAEVASWVHVQAGRLGLALPDGMGLAALAERAMSGDPGTWAARALDSARSGGGRLFSLGADLVLIPVLTFYLLLDWHPMTRGAWNLVPLPRQAGLRAFVAECDAMLGGYLRGQLAVMAILAAYYSAGLALAGFDLALPIGVFTGLAVCVPFVGFGVGLVLALLAGLLQFPALHAAIAVAVIYGIGQVLEGYVLVPRLVGRRIGLHPLLVIFLLLAGGQLFGLPGVLLALPAGALLVVVARHALASYRAGPLYRGH